MPRSLTIERTVVPVGERERWLERSRSRRDHFKRANCNYWVFEEVENRGAFVEFTEARDAGALVAARRSAPSSSVDEAPLFQEVDFSQL